MMSAAQSQEGRQTERAPRSPQTDERPVTAGDAPPPADALLDVRGKPSRVNQLVDGDLVFSAPGQSPYVRDIKLSDSRGGVRVYAADALATVPAGAAIQVFGNSAAPFSGQLFLDSGANSNAALIFRTAGTGGTITERMRLGANGNLGIGTSSTSFARMTVIASSGPALRASSPKSDGINGFSTESRGVAGFSETGIGVVGNSLAGIGVRGSTNSTGGLAGQFDGNVEIRGNLTKSSGSFKIDHPLDPANKYLSHSFVESPDMMNIYNGNVVLDGRGEAVVAMPDWFDALNRDFRYQLTAVGAPAPDLHVAAEVERNRFAIAGGRPGMKVSWQVTGVRRDAYAEAYRIKVEEEKPAGQRGRYLNPEAFGQPRETGMAVDEWFPESGREVAGQKR
jgi:hypothetical protein